MEELSNCSRHWFVIQPLRLGLHKIFTALGANRFDEISLLLIRQHDKWKSRSEKCETDEGAVCSCSAWVCLKLPLSPLSAQVDMSWSDSHPHSHHSFFFFPPPILYLCSSALNQQNQSISLFVPSLLTWLFKTRKHTLGVSQEYRNTSWSQSSQIFIYICYVYIWTYFLVSCLSSQDPGRRHANLTAWLLLSALTCHLSPLITCESVLP